MNTAVSPTLPRSTGLSPYKPQPGHATYTSLPDMPPATLPGNPEAGLVLALVEKIDGKSRIQTDRSGDQVKDFDLNIPYPQQDGINVRHDNTVARHNTIRNDAYNQDGHTDGVQLIPPEQYAAGRLNNITLDDNHLLSDGNMQPIFASDGVFKHLTITNNTVGTSAQNVIAINGMLTGQVSGNKDTAGNSVPAVLNPIRLGGDNNILVLSSTTPGYQYGKVTGDVIDHRNVPTALGNTPATVVEDFPMDDFLARYHVLKAAHPPNNGNEDAALASQVFRQMAADGTCQATRSQSFMTDDEDQQCTYFTR